LRPSNNAPPITIVYLTNRGWCGADGTGGCDMLILSKKSGHYQNIGELSVTEPITLLGRAKDGYPILGVMTAGLPNGGATGLVWAALEPKNGRYPDANGARRLPPHARTGRVLIGKATVSCNFRHLPPGPACQGLLKQQGLHLRS
jgi:hypothetical protein